MRKIRIGNDIQVSWEVKTNGEAVSLEGRTLRIQVRTAYFRQEITEFSVRGCTLTFIYPAKLQKMTGAYAVVLEDATEGSARRTLCADEAFTLVSHTCEENTDSGSFDEYLISLKSNILVARPGMSAYEVWLADGNKGTVEEYFNWLREPAFDSAEEVKQAEKKRTEAENGRIRAERERTEAEAWRQTAERERESNENLRKQTELKRVDKEVERETAVEAAVDRCTRAAERAESLQVSVDGGELVITINEEEE